MQIGSCSLSSWGGATPNNMTYFLLQCSALKCDWSIQTNENVGLNSSVLRQQGRPKLGALPTYNFMLLETGLYTYTCSKILLLSAVHTPGRVF